VLANLNRGEAVQVLARSNEKMRVGRMYQYWYQVKTAKGLTGWVYGYYINQK